MPIQDTITQAQEEFVESYDTAIDTFIEQSALVEEEQVDPLRVLGGLIIADYWLQDLLMANAINQYMFRIDSVLDDLQPDAILILGDTNSCLSAIAAG